MATRLTINSLGRWEYMTSIILHNNSSSLKSGCRPVAGSEAAGEVLHGPRQAQQSCRGGTEWPQADKAELQRRR